MKIKELKLYSNHLKEQKEFYVSLFGLELINDAETSFTVKMGATLLSFIKSEDNPYYHYAINIPFNQISESAKWLKERVYILPYEDKEIVNSPAWNAKSIYFYDADKNIVEFIARKNLNLNSSEPFTGKSLLHVSEIGIPTSNVPELFKKLNKEEEGGLEKYDCDLERFCAVGDEYGLFIVVNYYLKKWLPLMDEALPFPFEILFDNNKGNTFNLRIENETIIPSINS
jgi:catechol-2,3-dioxygenase